MKHRSLLTVLAAVSTFSLAQGTPIQKSNPGKAAPGIQQKATTEQDDLSLSNPAEAENLLISCYLPMFKRNEGESFSFYKCANGMVTVGYGSNVQKNPHFLDNVIIYKDGKALTSTEKEAFMTSAPSMTKDQLAEYSITRTAAEEMAKKSLREAIQVLVNTFRDSKTGKSTFYDLPVPMQALALDVFCNVGRKGFKKYKKFKAALLRRDWTTALKESVVYVNKKTKSKNLKREWSKQRLYNIMTIVQAHKASTPAEIKALVTKDYQAKTSSKRREGDRHTNLEDELLIAMGEVRHVRWLNALARAQKASSPKLAAHTPSKGATPFVPPTGNGLGG